MANFPNFVNKLLNSVLKENEIGVEIRDINFPGIPQYEELDCFRAFMILAVSRGDVLIVSNNGKFPFTSRKGTSSSAPGTEDFVAKWLFRMLLFCSGLSIVLPPSIREATEENFWLFISLVKIPNFFLAEIE